MNEDTPVGRRIRYYRNRLQLSQATLAGLVDRSESWLQKVEAGDLPMDSMSVLIALANVLKVGTWDLQPKLGLPPNGGAPLDPPQGMHAISRAVMTASPDQQPPSASVLHASVLRACDLNADGHFQAVSIILPSLITDARAASAQDTPAAWWALANAYRIAAGLALTLGDATFGWIAADRAVTAAQRSADPLMAAVCQETLSYALGRRGWLDESAAVCSDAADAIAPTADGGPEVWSVWGALQFGAATAAVRAKDTASARRSLRDAAVAAEHVGEGGNYYWRAFGPGSVLANEVMVALEIGDVADALRITRLVDLESLPTKWRRARFLIDVAQAYGLRRDDAAAVNALLQAEEHSSGTVRYSVQAHELVRACLKREQKHRTPQLRGLAERLGVTTLPT